MQNKSLTCLAVIPARYESSRFPGKPLALIAGKSLIQRSYENALRCPLLTSVLVATDDERIFDHVQSFGGKVAMTSPDCINGTERLAEIYREHYVAHGRQLDFIVNLQGDEPCVAPDAIEAIINVLINDSSAVMGTAVVPISSKEEALNPSIVKCVFDRQGNALYFSRSLIPGIKDGTYSPSVTYYQHVGIYSYRPEFLLKYVALPSTPLQTSEDLEQLKVIEYGQRIKAAIISGHSFGVDTPEDLIKVEKYLCTQNISS